MVCCCLRLRLKSRFLWTDPLSGVGPQDSVIMVVSAQVVPSLVQ